MSTPINPTKPTPTAIEGEGSYYAAHAYRKDVEEFLETSGDKVEKLAREAAQALDGPEGGALRAAEAEAKPHKKDD